MNPSPKSHEENMEIMKRELDYQGVSVIIPAGSVSETATRALKEAKKQKEKVLS